MMNIDSHRQYLTPREAAEHFASKPCVNAVRKWMKIGVHNRTVPNGQGERIKLRSIKEGAIGLTCFELI